MQIVKYFFLLSRISFVDPSEVGKTLRAFFIKVKFSPVLRIRDILERIRIRGSIPLYRIITKSLNGRNQGFLTNLAWESGSVSRILVNIRILIRIRNNSFEDLFDTVTFSGGLEDFEFGTSLKVKSSKFLFFGSLVSVVFLRIWYLLFLKSLAFLVKFFSKYFPRMNNWVSVMSIKHSF